MKLQWFFLFLLLGISVSLPAQQAPQQTPSRRSLPDDNLAYPILIEIGNSTGSGFFMNTKAATYLVTAKHVLYNQTNGLLFDNTIRLTSYSKDLSDQTPNTFTIDIAKLEANNVMSHATQDVVIIKILTRDQRDANMTNTIPGVTLNTVAKLGIIGVSPENTRIFNDVLIGNDVMIMGYPVSLGLQSMPQIDSRRPLLRKGIVAGLHRTNRSIILDCPVYPGNSGGPVLEIDREGFGYRIRVIGVVSQYVPYADGGRTFSIMANSGYSVAVPMDYVLELIK